MSSSPNKDVFKYELDITDIEAKAQRVLALLEQVQKGRASGANTSGVEAELTKIKAALDALEQKGAKASGGGASGAGAAAKQAAKDFEELSAATADAGESALDFDRKAEKLVKGSLGALAPEMAGAADLAFDLIQGLGKVSPTMFAIAVATGGAVAALKILGDNLRDAQVKADRFAEWQRGMREKAIQGQGGFADQLLTLGVNPGSGAQVANETFMRLANGGMPQSMAREVATASVFAAANNIPFDEQQFSAGLAVAGGKMPGAENATQYRAVMQRVLSAGQRPDAAQVLGDYLAARGNASRMENIGTPTATPGDTQATQDQIIAEKQQRGDIDDLVARRSRTFLQDRGRREATAIRELIMSEYGIQWLTERFGITANEDRIALGVAAQAEQEATHRLGGRTDVGPPTPSAPQRFQPIIIQNVGSQFNGAGNPMMSPFHNGALAAPGGGMLDVSNGR